MERRTIGRPWLTLVIDVATRAIIVIEADNPSIGTIAFIAVGMLEVSSCMIGSGIIGGYHVEKGEELGFFQFGGSTECLIFQPGSVKDFNLAAIPQTQASQQSLVLVRSHLATAAK